MSRDRGSPHVWGQCDCGGDRLESPFYSLASPGGVGEPGGAELSPLFPPPWGCSPGPGGVYSPVSGRVQRSGVGSGAEKDEPDLLLPIKALAFSPLCHLFI